MPIGHVKGDVPLHPTPRRSREDAGSGASAHARTDAPAEPAPSRGAATRSAILAGLGSTTSLVAAVALGAAVVTSSIAFNAWPGPPSGPGDAEVRLAVPEVPAAVTAATVATTAAASSAAGATSAAAGSAATPGGTPPRPGSRAGTGGADPAPSRRSGTRTAPSVTAAAPQPGGSATTPSDGASTEPGLPEVTELAGQALASGVATGTHDLVTPLSEVAPRTSGAVKELGQVSGDTVGEAAEAVAEALRKLPLE